MQILRIILYNAQTNAIIRAIDNCLRYGKIIVVVTNDLSFRCYITVSFNASDRSVTLVIFNQQRRSRMIVTVVSADDMAGWTNHCSRENENMRVIITRRNVPSINYILEL